MLIVCPEIQIPEEELEFTYARSSGPGGQAVNKVNSKAILRWHPLQSVALSEGARARFLNAFGKRLSKEGALLIASDTFRDQRSNQESCREKLAELLLTIAKPPKVRRPTKPTRGSKERKLDGKKRVGANKALRRKVSHD
ncbi:MAG: aminoacyl-tRNA hydrolase [Proteobacteria bacterium]|nr:MAG: aminoacyl-tRNA hydrolase [Pseudomonadota bacterium]